MRMYGIERSNGRHRISALSSAMRHRCAADTGAIVRPPGIGVHARRGGRGVASQQLERNASPAAPGTLRYCRRWGRTVCDLRDERHHSWNRDADGDQPYLTIAGSNRSFAGILIRAGVHIEAHDVVVHTFDPRRQRRG